MAVLTVNIHPRATACPAVQRAVFTLALRRLLHWLRNVIAAVGSGALLRCAHHARVRADLGSVGRVSSRQKHLFLQREESEVLSLSGRKRSSWKSICSTKVHFNFFKYREEQRHVWIVIDHHYLHQQWQWCRWPHPSCQYPYLWKDFLIRISFHSLRVWLA